MPTCPSGHDSASTDFCDVCGMRMDGPAPLASSSSSSSSSAAATSPGAAPAAVPAEPCTRCGAARTGQFCEVCGFNFDSGVAPAAAAGSPGSAGPGAGADASPGPGSVTGTAAGSNAEAVPDAAAGWTAVVTADRAYYDSVIAEGGPDAASIEFPGYCPERRFRLTGREMRIGRRSVSRGLEPEIDLTGPPADPGVSHLHAVLIAEPDGTWAVLDPGSANGTSVNNGEIVVGVRVPLHDGDRICVGAWTVLTIQAAAAS
jgi:FHA domain